MSTAPEPQFLLLWKGRQSGPFSVEAIREKLNSGEISRMHQVNFKGKWIVLDEFFEKHADGDPEAKRKAEAEKREEQMQRDFQNQLATERAHQSELEARLTEAEKRAKLSHLLPSQAPPPSPQPAQYLPPSPPPPPQYLPQSGSQYQPPPPPFVAEKPQSYMVAAILSTLFCFLPFGIVSIVYAAQVDSKFNAGDYEGAQQSSDKARTWYCASIGTGVVAIIIVFLGFAANH
jgi:hypothetical protein